MRRTPEQHSASISEDLALSTCLQEALISKRIPVAPKVQGGHPVLVQCCLILVFETNLYLLLFPFLLFFLYRPVFSSQ